MNYCGGVVAIAGIVAVAATTGDFARGGMAFGSGDIMNYCGGVVAIAGIVAVAATTGDFARGGMAFGTLFRFAMICIFLRRAARRARIPWTTVRAC